MKKSTIILWFFIILSSLFFVQASQLIPQRCLFSPGISCMEFSVDSETNQLSFAFMNQLNEDADFWFKAFLMREVNISALNCLCEGGTSCNIGSQGIGYVNCTFPEGAFKKSESTKFYLEINIVKSTGNQTTAVGQVYQRPLKNSFLEATTPQAYILAFLILIILYILYIVLIKLVQKAEKMKKWFKKALLAFFISMIVVSLLTIIMLRISMLGLEDAEFYPLRDLIIIPQIFAFIISLLIFGITTLVSYLNNKKKPNKL